MVRWFASKYIRYIFFRFEIKHGCELSVYEELKQKSRGYKCDY